MKIAIYVIFLCQLVQAQSPKLQNLEATMPKSVHGNIPCTQAYPCSTGSINLPWDSAGSACGTPFWGNCGFTRFPVTIEGVPADDQLVITRISGDVIGWAVGDVPAGHFSGILWGAWSSNALSSTAMDGNVLVANSSCQWYDQGALGGGSPLNVDFDRPNLNWRMGPDNTLTIQLAQFLNDTGRSIHMELTVVIWYYYTAPSKDHLR